MSEDTNPSAPAQPEADSCSIADALKRAKAELDKAQACYENLKQQAADRVKAVRETSVGDMIDGTLDAVKRHPAAGLTLAALLGYFLGRLFKR